jgi:hypothetical protein
MTKLMKNFYFTATQKTRSATFVLHLGMLLVAPIHGEEGMIPISEVKNLNLKERGILLLPEEVFDPDGISLVDGICRVNGCTGSFVSSGGLIITNHHCAYSAIQQASTPENDFLANGFQARSLEEEIQAPGYVVRVTESYEDVSEQVLSVVQPGMDFLSRTKAIDRKSRELEKAAETDNPGLRAEVAEMFAGKTYGLFLYTYLRDVRLVFAPPASVGNFGGEVDNWEWPRHTGDFAFMRAYTAPDGSSAAPDAQNVPYHPKKVVRIQKAGVEEGDTVFLLGYPGRTARHKTASFLHFEQSVRLPAVVDLYRWQIAEMTAAAAENRSLELKVTSRIKSLANVDKRSRGQLQGLFRAGLARQREIEESGLQNFIDSSPDRSEKYGRVLADLEQLYLKISRDFPAEFHLDQLKSVSRLAGAAWFVVDSVAERAKPDIEREPAYADKNFEQSLQLVRNSLRDYHAATDQQLFTGLVARMAMLPELAGKKPLAELSEEGRIDYLFANSQLDNMDFVEQCLKMNGETLRATNDPFVLWMLELYPTYVELRESNKRREGELNELYGLLLDVKKDFQATDFVPDANGTLRLTSGTIRAYSPADAVIRLPISTFRGIVEKTTGTEPFATPDEVMNTWKAGLVGDYTHPTLKEIPVGILYDADTTGGNSGSPVFNSRGELVGVNFDRCFEATINDFAWNDAYSRSIGVDIRYVLWIVDKVYGAQQLIDELDLN